jgi:hypothetical protein
VRCGGQSPPFPRTRNPLDPRAQLFSLCTPHTPVPGRGGVRPSTQVIDASLVAYSFLLGFTAAAQRRAQSTRSARHSALHRNFRPRATHLVCGGPRLLPRTRALPNCQLANCQLANRRPVTASRSADAQRPCAAPKDERFSAMSLLICRSRFQP